MGNLRWELPDASYDIDVSRPMPLAIPLDFSGPQPSYFSVPRAQRKPWVDGTFVGDIHQRGPCNVDSVTVIPHCQGTHTESISHVADPPVAVGSLCQSLLIMARLMTVQPVPASTSLENYHPPLRPGDWIIPSAALVRSESAIPSATALILRTLPNGDHKKTADYSPGSAYPFFTHEAMQVLREMHVEHLLVDTPSIDRLDDDGLLSNHRWFWELPATGHTWTNTDAARRTITEMIYVPDGITDGVYVLTIQVPAWQLDAAPSRPILYPVRRL